MARNFKPLAILAAKSADEKGGEKVSLLYTKRLSALTDYLLIVSVHSPAQMDAVEGKISTSLEGMRLNMLHHEGSQSAMWRVLDYGGLLIHLMHPQARDFYSLDKLYREAPKIHWENSTASKARRHPAHRRGSRSLSLQKL